MVLPVLANKAKLFLTDQKYRFMIFRRYGAYDKMSDEDFLKLSYRINTGRELNLDDPKTFNEKLQWLKLYNRNPAYTNMVDKYAVKFLVSDRIGNEYIIPTIGLWEHFEDIDFDALPNQFVLKCTHDSGGIAICKDKSLFDYKRAKYILGRSLKRDYFWGGREWAYKNVPPRIIAEPYIVDESGFELKDYKIHNFNGEPKLIQVDFGRFSDHKRNIYTTDWQFVDATICYPNDPERQIERPSRLEEMLDISRTFAKGIPYVRTDLYVIGDKILFGEFTFYHGGGMERITPESLNVKMGEWIEFPKTTSNNS